MHVGAWFFSAAVDAQWMIGAGGDDGVEGQAAGADGEGVRRCGGEGVGEAQMYLPSFAS